MNFKCNMCMDTGYLPKPAILPEPPDVRCPNGCRKTNKPNREAELELEIARLRKVISETYKYVDQMYSDLIGHLGAEWLAAKYADDLNPSFRKALSTPPSTTALQALIEKVEKLTIERCAEYLDETDSQYYDGYEFRTLTPSDLGECLRALPTQIKLEEL